MQGLHPISGITERAQLDFWINISSPSRVPPTPHSIHWNSKGILITSCFVNDGLKLTLPMSCSAVQVVAFLPADSQVHSSGVTAASVSSRQWLLFDSHPRPHLGLVGASVRSFGGEVALVEALTAIFPPLDLGTDNVSANMYNMIDCTPMQLK